MSGQRRVAYIPKGDNSNVRGAPRTKAEKKADDDKMAARQAQQAAEQAEWEERNR